MDSQNNINLEGYKRAQSGRLPNACIQTLFNQVRKQTLQVTWPELSRGRDGGAEQLRSKFTSANKKTRAKTGVGITFIITTERGWRILLNVTENRINS